MGSLRVEHDDQLSERVCADCGVRYRSVIGIVYENDEAIAIYEADLFDHFHKSQEPRVMLSIAVGDWSDGTRGVDRCSASLEAWGVQGGALGTGFAGPGARRGDSPLGSDEVHMIFSSRAGSPWQELGVVGWQLTPQQALTSPLREAFYRIADHIAISDYRLRKVLAVKTTAS